MYSDDEAADSMMAGLAELLRLTLEEGTAAEVPLQRELELLDRYLAIERIRFEERLRLSVEVKEGRGRCWCPRCPCSRWSTTRCATASSGARRADAWCSRRGAPTASCC
jgi:hypothetical protein